MANQPLTPEQQAALDQFIADSQAAQEAHTEKVKADSNLAGAQIAVTTTTATDIADHQAALASAQAFIDLMVPPQPQPPTPTSGKKG